MKKNLLIILLILFVPLIAYKGLTRGQVDSAPKQEQKQTANKPQVIKFTSLMCLDCKKMNQVVKEVFPKYDTKISLVEIQVQSDSTFVKEQIKKYNITVVPTIVFIDKNGKTVKVVEDLMSKKQFEKELKALTNG